MANLYLYGPAAAMRAAILFFTNNFYKRSFALAMAVCLFSWCGQAQFISGYTATNTAGSYTCLSGATNLCTSGCSNISYNVTLPWSFNFNGVPTTVITVNTNGWIQFGSGSTPATGLAASTTTPLSSATAISGGGGVIACYGSSESGNAFAQSGTCGTYHLCWKNNGTSFSIEWHAWSTSNNVHDQLITLYQTTNNITMQCNVNSANYLIAGTSQGQLGIRGTTNSEFKNFTLSSGSWSGATTGGANTNASTMAITTSATNYNSLAGRIFTFTAPTFCTMPTTQGSAGSAANITNTQCDINFTRGNGTGGVLVVARLNATAAAAPASGTSYGSPSTVFGSGTPTTGTNNFPVYNGTANGTGAAISPITITNLTPGSTYAFDVYEYNTASTCYMTPAYTFTVAIPLCLPPTTQASGSGTSSVTTTAATLSWTSGNGTAGEFVVLNQGSAVATDPTQNTGYTANAAFGSGSLIGTGRVIYAGNAGTVNITGLQINTTYHYAIYTYDSSGPCYKTPAHTGSFITANGAMTYTSSTTVQVTAGTAVAQGASNQQILQVQVVTGTGTSPVLTMSSLTFNTNGSTNISGDITAARIYYTGTSSTFATTTPFGSDVTTFPGGATPIVVSGTAALSSGTNYFWIVYDVSIGSTIANLLDGECTSINYGTVQTPSATAPAGTRPIASVGTFSCMYTGGNGPATYSTIFNATGGIAPTTTAVNVFSGNQDNAIDNTHAVLTFPAGFTFKFNDITYSNIGGISTNGFIWFGSAGSAVSTSLYAPISTASIATAGTVDGVISAYGADLWARTVFTAQLPASSQITVFYSGISPNRICKIEWCDYVTKTSVQTGTSDRNRMDFQIWLYENGGTTPNKIEMHYRDQNPFLVQATPTAGQIGLRGATNAEFSTRSASVGAWASSISGTVSSTCLSNNSLSFLNGNQGFNWVLNIATPILNPTPTAANICPATTATITSVTSNPASPTYQWYKNNIAISGATSSSYAASTSGNYLMVASNGSCGKPSAVTAVTIAPCNVNITASAGTGGSITPSGTVSVVYNASQGFTIAPACGYNISDVLVDGVSQGAITTYTFNNVIVTHTIAASFVAITEICNGLDDDCDGFTDEGFDVDADGYTTCQGDCNDGNSAVNPGATEVCSNGIDDDCDGTTDEDPDADGDGYTVCAGDCDDTNPAVHPGVDYWADGDGDGYGSFIYATGCYVSPPAAGLVFIGGDCNDSNPAVNPGITEVCYNLIDDDCDGLVDEMCVAPPNDNFANAILIPQSGLAYPTCNMINGTCVNATVSAEGTAANVVGGGKDVWYKVVAPSSGLRIVSNTASSMNIVLELHNSVGAQMDVENDVAVSGGESMATGSLTAGATYYIAVRAYGPATGTFTICVQSLNTSHCSDGSGVYQLCSNFKASYTGANNYTYNFTPINGTTGSPTSVTGNSGLVALASPTLGIQYGGSYNATIDVTYNLTDAAGNPEVIIVPGTDVCSLVIAPHANVEVKPTQRCEATLLRGNILVGKPYVCAATGFTVRFTQVTNCSGATTVGLPFTVNTPAGAASLYLNFTLPQPLLTGAYYRVEFRPTFSYGNGIYGSPQVIHIGGAAMAVYDMDDEHSNFDREEIISPAAAIYPNPNAGQLLNINLTNLESNDVYVRIIDFTGKMVYTNRFIADGSLNTVIVFERPLASGMYTIEFVAGKEVMNEKMIVQK